MTRPSLQLDGVPTGVADGVKGNHVPVSAHLDRRQIGTGIRNIKNSVTSYGMPASEERHAPTRRVTDHTTGYPIIEALHEDAFFLVAIVRTPAGGHALEVA